MVKIISKGLALPDDPMFTGRVETFSVRKSKPPSTNPNSGAAGEKQTVAPRKGMLKQLKDSGLTEEQAMKAILDI